MPYIFNEDRAIEYAITTPQEVPSEIARYRLETIPFRIAKHRKHGVLVSNRVIRIALLVVHPPLLSIFHRFHQKTLNMDDVEHFYNKLFVFAVCHEVDNTNITYA